MIGFKMERVFNAIGEFDGWWCYMHRDGAMACRVCRVKQTTNGYRTSRKGMIGYITCINKKDKKAFVQFRTIQSIIPLKNLELLNKKLRGPRDFYRNWKDVKKDLKKYIKERGL